MTSYYFMRNFLIDYVTFFLCFEILRYHGFWYNLSIHSVIVLLSDLSDRVCREIIISPLTLPLLALLAFFVVTVVDEIGSVSRISMHRPTRNITNVLEACGAMLFTGSLNPKNPNILTSCCFSSYFCCCLHRLPGRHSQ